MKKLVLFVATSLLLATGVQASSTDEKKVSVSTVPPTHTTPLAKASFEKKRFFDDKMVCARGNV
jgi:hypothetical protein